MTAREESASEVDLAATMAFMQQTVKHMFTICSNNMGTGKGMSELEVNNLLGMFQRLASYMEQYANFYAVPMKPEAGMMKVKEETSKSETKVDGRSTEMEASREITEEEMEAWREAHDVPSPENDPFQKVLEDNGVDYDSDHSRGV